MGELNTTIREVAEVRGLIGGPFGSSLVGTDYTDVGIPVIRGTNLNHGQYIAGPFAYVSEEKANTTLARNQAAPTDIIFTQRGTLGQVAIVPEAGPDRYIISQSQMRLRVDPSKAIPKFVYYACKTASFQRQIAESAISTGVPHINLGILSRLTIPTTPIEEQQAIAEVLGALDDKIAANTNLATTADELASTILRSALSTGEPAPLSQIATITMGSSPPGSSYNETGAGTVFYQGVRDFGVRFPHSRVWTTEPARMAQRHDTLLSVRAPVGYVNIATEPTCIGRGLASVRSTLGAPWTLFHLLKATPSIWEPFEAEGTVFGSINKTQLNGLSIPTVPSYNAAHTESRIAALEDRLDSALKENAHLAATRDALLPALMSGTLRVRDAERIVESVL